MENEISVVMPAYNHEGYVEASMRSVLEGPCAARLIVVDDGSTDRTGHVARRTASEFPESRVLVLHQENTGICGALNAGLAHVDTDFVTILASDDLWVADGMARVMEELRNAPPDVACVYGACEEFDESRGVVRPRNLRPADGSRELDFLRLLERREYMLIQSAVFRSAVFSTDGIGRFDETLPYEDFDIQLRIARKYRMVHSDVLTVRKRVVEGSMNTRLHRYLDSNLRILAKHQAAPRVRAQGAGYYRSLRALYYERAGRRAYGAGDTGAAATIFRRMLLDGHVTRRALKQTIATNWQALAQRVRSRLPWARQ